MEIQRRLDWNLFEPKFGSWSRLIKPFFDSGGFEPIYAHLKKRGASHTICPSSEDTFKVFEKTDFNSVNVIILGACPYHTIKGNVIVADGLLMGCSRTKSLQPSLEQFYNELERTYNDGLCLQCIKDPDVSYLCERGVFMGNVAYTVEAKKAMSHNTLWEPFTKYLLEEVFPLTGAPIIFLGKDAGKCAKYLPPLYWSFTVTHPASASYKGMEWNSEGVFKKVDKITKENNNIEINWLKTHEK